MQVDLLEGLQHSKLSYSTRSDSDSSLHASFIGSSLPSPGSERGPLAPHAAWEALLTTRLSFLLSEIQAAADFLGLIKVEQARPSSQVIAPGVYTGL